MNIVSVRPATPPAPHLAAARQDKPATRPAPQPAAASVSRRDAPKGRLTSTHVNVWFNSPDKVQMYYEDAKYGNVWKAFGQWDSTWPGINERDLNPSETSPNGGTRFMVENKTTGQTFIVDKSNATFTALPDGRTRIAIEDRPGSKTPGSDIVLLLEPKFAPVKHKGRTLLQDTQLEGDLRIIENWPEHKASVRQQALNDIFGHLTSEAFTRGWNPTAKDLLRRMQPLFNQMQKAMPEAAFARLGAVLRAICKDKEKFFVPTNGSIMTAVNANGKNGPSLHYNRAVVETVKSAEGRNFMLAHELAHLAYESPMPEGTTSNLLKRPTLLHLMSQVASAAKLPISMVGRSAAIGVAELIANDTAQRTGSLAKAAAEFNGDDYCALPALFVEAFLAQMPRGAFPYQKTLPGVFWWATDKNDKTWKYDGALTRTFQQKVGRDMKVTFPGDPGRVVGSIKKDDLWITAFLKLGLSHQSAHKPGSP
jgi:hypothetical protein